MGRICFLCKRSFEKASTRSYHRFPCDRDRREKWFENIGMAPVDTRNIYLCSDHFTSTAFYLQPGGIRRLNKDALPFNLPSTSELSESESSEAFSSSASAKTVKVVEQNTQQVTTQSGSADLAQPLSSSSATLTATESVDDEPIIATQNVASTSESMGPPKLRFPHQRPKILKRWIRAIRRKNWRPSKTSLVCSRHFLSTDYIVRPGSIKRILKLDAVPSIFPPVKRIEVIHPNQRVKIPLADDECMSLSTESEPEPEPKLEIQQSTENVLSLDTTENNIRKSIDENSTPSILQVKQFQEVNDPLSACIDRQQRYVNELKRLHKNKQIYFQRKIKTLTQKLRRRDKTVNILKERMKNLKRKYNKVSVPINLTDETQIDKLCRICLSEIEGGIAVFEDEEEKPNIPSMLKYFSLKLTNHELLPKFICTDCYQKLQNFYRFREVFKVTQQRLRNLLSIKENLPKQPECALDEEPSMLEEAEICELEVNEDEIKPTPESEQITIVLLENNEIPNKEKERELICPECNTICENTSIFEEHLGSHSKKNLCETCMAWLPKSKFLQEFRPLLPNKCNICFKSLTNTTKFLGAQLQFKCKETNCGAICMSKFALFKHTKSAHQYNLYFCEECNATLKGYENYRQHTFSQHKKNTPCVCLYCGKTFPVAEELNEHLLKHSVVGIECNSCSKRFNSKKLLDMHLQNECIITYENFDHDYCMLSKE